MPSRAVIITGGTVNLGFETARVVARDYPDYLVVLASRTDPNKAADAINNEVKRANAAEFRRLDLADLASVRQFAAEWAKGGPQNPPIQALILNAGVQMGPKLSTAPTTGLETTFAINHVGHALLFHLLVPYFATADLNKRARVAVVTSATHDPTMRTGYPPAVYTTAEALAHPPPKLADAGGQQHYCNSKLANLLWTYKLDRELQARAGGAAPQIAVNAFDPGIMPGTDLVRSGSRTGQFVWKHVLPHMLPVVRLLAKPSVHTTQESGASLARLALGRELEGVSGKYIDGTKEVRSSATTYEAAKQDDLWDWTVKYLAGGGAAEEARFREFR